MLFAIPFFGDDIDVYRFLDIELAFLYTLALCISEGIRTYICDHVGMSICMCTYIYIYTYLHR